MGGLRSAKGVTPVMVLVKLRTLTEATDLMLKAYWNSLSFVNTQADFVSVSNTLTGLSLCLKPRLRLVKAITKVK